MKIPYVVLTLPFVLVLLSSTAYTAVRIGDEECEPLLVSRGDYEGAISKPWLRDQTLSLEDRLYREFLYEAFGFLADHMRWPSQEESRGLYSRAIATLIGGDSPDLVVESPENLLQKRPPTMSDFQVWFPNRYFYVRRKIASFYIRAVRQTDLEKRFRTVATSPSHELLFYAAIKGKTNGGPTLLRDYVQGKLTLEALRDLYEPDRYSLDRHGAFPQPLIFPNGQDELEKAARMDAPFAFAQFIDTRKIVTRERAEKTLSALEHASGFVAVSWTSGKPLQQDFFDLLLKYVEERDYVLLVGPTQQTYEGLPEIFIEHPRVHVLTHTIENNFLKISNEPINPDIENPLTELKKAGRYKPGQIVLVFHPHLMLEHVPTTTNEIGSVALLSSGSLNQSFAPFSAVTQGRRKIANKGFHTVRAWAFEKADHLAGFDSNGIQNSWHYRPLNFYDDREFDGTTGFIDIGKNFRFNYAKGRNLEVVPAPVEVLYKGDPHDPETDPRPAAALVRDLGLNTDTHATFISGDTFDFASISHHLDGRRLDQQMAYQHDSLSLQNAVNGVIQTVSSLLQRYPQARYAQIVGNHDEWLTRLLNQTPDVQNIINGDFIDELNFVVKTLHMNVWEYIFKEREKILNALLTAYPDKRVHIIRRLLPVYDPDRIDILDRVRFYVGPEHRKNSVGDHGDRASYGKRNPSLKDHAKGMPEGGGVTGHTHKPGIYKDNMDPGTMGPLAPTYGKGFQSATGQGVVLIYENGTKQLFLFNQKAGSFIQHDVNQVKNPGRFFGDHRLKIISNDNDLVDKHEGLEVIRRELENLKSLTNPEKVPPL
jgi:hypothetical protein